MAMIIWPDTMDYDPEDDDGEEDELTQIVEDSVGLDYYIGILKGIDFTLTHNDKVPNSERVSKRWIKELQSIRAHTVRAIEDHPMTQARRRLIGSFLLKSDQESGN